MNVAMWGKALRVIPRVSKQEWDTLDPIARWLIATRSAVLVMTFMSSAIAGLFALRDRAFDGRLWGVTTLGLLLAHATNNLLNDLTDHVRGVDKGNYFRTQYGPQPLEHGLMTRAEHLRYSALTGALALVCGAYLVWLRGQTTLVLFAFGAFFVLFYTWPLKAIGLGELAVVVVWGPMMTGGAYQVVTGRFDWTVAVASIAFALGPTAVLMGKHIDKLEADAEKKIRTLPVLLGERAARATTLAMLIGQYVLVGWLVASRQVSPLLLVVLGALGPMSLAYRAYRARRPKEPPKELPAGIWPLWYVAFAFHHTRRFGTLFVVGLVLDVVARRMGWI